MNVTFTPLETLSAFHTQTTESMVEDADKRFQNMLDSILNARSEPTRETHETEPKKQDTVSESDDVAVDAPVEEHTVAAPVEEHTVAAPVQAEQTTVIETGSAPVATTPAVTVVLPNVVQLVPPVQTTTQVQMTQAQPTQTMSQTAQVQVTQATITAPDAATTSQNTSIPANDILSVQVQQSTTTETQPQQVAPAQQQATVATASDKLSEMLGQAQKVLENLAATQQTATGNTPSAVNTDTAEPVPAQQPSSTQENLPTATVKEQPSMPIMEQRPLNEMPETDRAVLDMKKSQAMAPETQDSAEPLVVATESKMEQSSRAQAPATTNAPAQQPQTGADQMEQVRVQLTQNMEQGRTEFRMQLQPQELGKVDVRMVLESGRLAVEIMASTPKAAELLAKQAETLMQSLRMQNIDVQSLNIVSQTQSADGQMGGAFNMLNGQAQDGQEASSQPYSSGRGNQDGIPEDDILEKTTRNPESRLDRAV